MQKSKGVRSGDLGDQEWGLHDQSISQGNDDLSEWKQHKRSTSKHHHAGSILHFSALEYHLQAAAAIHLEENGSRPQHLSGQLFVKKATPFIDNKSSSVLLGSAMSRSYFASENETPTTKLLEWVPVINNSENVGKVLVVLYLIQGDGERMGDGDTGERMPLYIVPVTVTYRLEVLFWGIRGFTAHTSKPFVTIMFADNLISSGSIENISSFPNFNNSPVILDVKLPVLEKYSAPFVIRVMDSKWFGMKHYVGSGVIENVLNFFLISLPTSEEWLSVRQSVIFKPVSYNQLMTFNEDQNESFRNGGFKYILKCLKESLIRILIAVNSPLKFIFKLKSSNYDKLDSDMLIESEEMRAVEARSYDYRKKHFDWWTKYCASKNQIFSPNNETCHMISETIKGIVSQRETTFEFYRDELEAQPQFSNFTDWCGTFPISQKKQETRDSKSIICYVKAAVVLYRKPLDTDILSRKGIVVDDINGVLKSDMPPNDPVKVLVRLYVIQGFEIHPPVNLNKPNAFLVVSTPLQTFGNSSTHIRQEANPCFGSFELELEFPVEYELTVTVMNYDTVRANELIGFTKIDLENRFYSKHRARCGLQTRYETHGYNQWRDQRTPSEILKILCDENNLPEPRYFLNCVSVGGCNFYGSSDHIDELALIALLQWENIPVVGRKLVREHVETRQLYHPNFPGIPRGSIEMWVDIFESNDTSPLPHSLMTDISPRMPIEYELRVIIWSTTKVKPRTGDPAFFGKKQCDIYVKGRLVGDSNEQNTDIHIRSVGFGNFNWRFIFQFHYLLSEESRIQDEHKGKCLLACNKGYSNKLPAIFNVQIWSKERTRSDFLIGSNSMELCNMVQGQLKWWQCNKESVWSASKDRINLFDMKKNRGWWPGYVEMEFHLITKEEAIRSPVGLGRREPEPLDAPTMFGPLETCTGRTAVIRFLFSENVLPMQILVIALNSLNLTEQFHDFHIVEVSTKACKKSCLPDNVTIKTLPYYAVMGGDMSPQETLNYIKDELGHLQYGSSSARSMLIESRNEKEYGSEKVRSVLKKKGDSLGLCSTGKYATINCLARSLLKLQSRSR
ncbi:ferlin family C2 domain-containing myoferlin misfire [Lycorma delicatula]|uniref:ferlin family C2 domain-containing myoferlin misfire n=1 Tax=Lycorma delicatula TaxID=130591 RepID=UPI003F517F1C